MNKLGWMVLAVLALAAPGCHDCDVVTCDEWCDGLGAPADPDLTFQVCVANASATSGDLVLRDADGEEVYSCEIEHDVLGQEVGSCSTDYAQAKTDYCACGAGSTY